MPSLINTNSFKNIFLNRLSFIQFSFHCKSLRHVRCKISCSFLSCELIKAIIIFIIVMMMIVMMKPMMTMMIIIIMKDITCGGVC